MINKRVLKYCSVISPVTVSLRFNYEGNLSGVGGQIKGGGAMSPIRKGSRGDSAVGLSTPSHSQHFETLLQTAAGGENNDRWRT